MNSHHSHWMLRVLLTGAIALAGCGHSPTAPVVSPASVDGGTSASGLYEAPVDDGGLSGPTPGVNTTVVVRGKFGGTVRAGAFTLEIPAGAFPGNATISMRQPDVTMLAVELRVVPASKSVFKVPATLTADASALSVPDLSQSALWSLNPSTGGYAPVAGSSVDVVNMNVHAPLNVLSPMVKVQPLQ